MATPPVTQVDPFRTKKRCLLALVALCLMLGLCATGLFLAAGQLKDASGYYHTAGGTLAGQLGVASLIWACIVGIGAIILALHIYDP